MAENLLKHTVIDNTSMGGIFVNIGFGVDNNYVRPMATAIASIRKNLSSNIDLNVHVITDGISDDNQFKLQQLAELLGIKINIYTIDTSELKQLPMRVLLPHATYFRLVLPKVIDKNIEHMYYFDADIVAISNLDKFFQESFEDNIVIAIPDVEFIAERRVKELELETHTYFNAGILAMNLPKWNKFDVFNKIIKAINKDPEKFKYFDQDALNLVLTGHIKYTSNRYNYINGCGHNEEDVAIIHYAANPKPWKFYFHLSNACNDFNKNFYKEYEQYTPWAKLSQDNPSNYKEMEACAKCLMKNGKTLQGLKWKFKYLVARMKYKLSK